MDKRWYFEGWTLNVYFDMENLLGSPLTGPGFLDVERDAAGQPLPDPVDPTRYQTKLVTNVSTTRLPSIGVMVEF